MTKRRGCQSALPHPVFFFDANLSEDLAHGIRAFGENVLHVNTVDGLGRGTGDETIIPYVGRQGGCLITRDERMRKQWWQLLKDHRVSVFCVVGNQKQKNKCRLIQQVVRHWPGMKREMQRQARRPDQLRAPHWYWLRSTGQTMNKVPL